MDMDEFLEQNEQASKILQGYWDAFCRLRIATDRHIDRRISALEAELKELKAQGGTMAILDELSAKDTPSTHHRAN